MLANDGFEQVRARGGNSWVAPALVCEGKCSEGREVSVSVSQRMSRGCSRDCRRCRQRPLQLRVEGLVIYYLVPHTLLPGVQVNAAMCRVTWDVKRVVCDPSFQAPFSIRVYCSKPVELQRVPTPR